MACQGIIQKAVTKTQIKVLKRNEEITTKGNQTNINNEILKEAGNYDKERFLTPMCTNTAGKWSPKTCLQTQPPQDLLRD